MTQEGRTQVLDCACHTVFRSSAEGFVASVLVGKRLWVQIPPVEMEPCRLHLKEAHRWAGSTGLWPWGAGSL